MKKKSGITLIALIITVIVLLILAGVSISIMIGDNGILKQAEEANIKTKNVELQEKVELAVISSIGEDGKSVDKEILSSELEKLGVHAIKEDNGEFPWIVEVNNNKFEISKNGNIIPELYVTIGENRITFKNLGEYLGKKVEYSPDGLNNGNISEYATSTTYRLFYVDFDGKYSGGAKGTIYLKADCDDKKIKLNDCVSYSGSSDNFKVMKELNPDWAKTFKEIEQNNEMKVAWMCDPNNWSDWKDSFYEDWINYVVGAPSLEMWVASYNEYLKKQSKNRVIYKNNSLTELAESLECMYIIDRNKWDFNGYIVKLLSQADYGYNTGKNSLFGPGNNEINETQNMYNSGKVSGLNCDYWLSSPCSHFEDSLMSVLYYESNVASTNVSGRSFCPVVSLKPESPLRFID